MAKFIIEVSDEYIREHADGEKMAAKATAASDGSEALGVLFDVIAFNQIKDALDEGKTEFAFTIDDMDDEKGCKIFNSVVSRIGTLYIIKDVNDRKKQEEK